VQQIRWDQRIHSDGRSCSNGISYLLIVTRGFITQEVLCRGNTASSATCCGSETYRSKPCTLPVFEINPDGDVRYTSVAVEGQNSNEHIEAIFGD
jgi:hypothetical protein